MTTKDDLVYFIFCVLFCIDPIWSQFVPPTPNPPEFFESQFDTSLLKPFFSTIFFFFCIKLVFFSFFSSDKSEFHPQPQIKYRMITGMGGGAIWRGKSNSIVCRCCYGYSIVQSNFLFLLTPFNDLFVNVLAVLGITRKCILTSNNYVLNLFWRAIYSFSGMNLLIWDFLLSPLNKLMR